MLNNKYLIINILFNASALSSIWSVQSSGWTIRTTYVDRTVHGLDHRICSDVWQTFYCPPH